MKRIANKWRYQNCDRFDNPKEYDFLNREDGDMTDQDKENAIAIASLLETFSQSKRNDVTGIGVETADYLNRMRAQVETLYGNSTPIAGDTSRVQKDCHLDPDWYNKPLAGDVRWAKATLKEILERDPEVTVTAKNVVSGDVSGCDDDDDSLRSQMSADQLRAFNHAVECFDANKPLRIFVHGGPGTGKTFLANHVMKAARIRGMQSRFTALSGAAATINGGTTIHYAMGMTKTTKWGSDPTANQIKKIRHRNRNMRVLIVDEISMTHAQMWNQVMKHLERAHLLAGLHIIAMGDMCQLPPPSQFVKPIYVDSVLAARKPAAYSTKPLVLAGIKSFQTLQKMELTTQNRANDSVHISTIRELREGIISDAFIDNLKPLTADDVNNGWKFVPILVTSNAEAILLNRKQIVEFAKTHDRFILKWTNPIRNCEDAESYDINIVEDIVPEAVQYFCMGAPGLVNANKNPVGTGIVNGYRVVQHSLVWKTNPWKPPKAGWKPGQIFEVHRPDYMVVIKESDDSKKDDSVEEPELIPLRTDHQKTWTQGVQISYNAFPFDLSFAITYHKVQGQTMKKVILFLHKRSTRQLAPLQWESLYVAYTRVKCGGHIRVCYFGSNDATDRTGLSHLKHLKRSELYDVWQKTYNTRGQWKDSGLRKQAVTEQNKLRRKLRRVTSISQVSLTKLKLWADVLDVNVPYQPGTKKKNKAQYVEAITPVWVGVNGGALSSGINNESNKMEQKRVQKMQSTKHRAVNHAQQKLTRRHKSTTVTKSTTSKTFISGDSSTSCHSHSRIDAVPPVLTARQRQNSLQITMQLRSRFGRFTNKRDAKRAMKNVTYCVRVPYVGEISQWSAFALATPGEFLCDTVIYFCGKYFCKDGDCKTHVVDPILVMDAGILLQTGLRERLLNRLHARLETLIFPINAPRNVHWMVVFVWLNSIGKLVVQCRNSMNSYRSLEDGCCARVRTCMMSLYNHCDNTEHTFPGFGSAQPVAWIEQTADVYACGLHVLSHIYLRSKNLEHTHIFDNDFVETLRLYCLRLLHEFRCGRRTTIMTPIDLTLDNPRFDCLNIVE